MHGGSHLRPRKSGEDDELEHCVGVSHDCKVKERFFSEHCLKRGGWVGGWVSSFATGDSLL